MRRLPSLFTHARPRLAVTRAHIGLHRTRAGRRQHADIPFSALAFAFRFLRLSFARPDAIAFDDSVPNSVARERQVTTTYRHPNNKDSI